MRQELTELMGKTIVKISVLKEGDDRIILRTSDKEDFIMYHSQDCCESVWIDDICGDLDDLLDTPILQATVDSDHRDQDTEYESATWTFYNFATIKGYVTIKWVGTSNGWYSEGVTFEKMYEYA